MLAFAASGPFRGGIVLVWDLDRLSRSFEFLLVELLSLRRSGVEVADCAHGVYDLAGLEGRLLLTVKASMAQEYSDRLSANIKRGLNDTVARGYWASRRVPYGCTLIGERKAWILARDANEAQHLDRLFELAGQETATETARAMWREHRPAPKGGHWSAHSVTIIVTNPVYIGKIRWNGVLYDGQHGPLVPVEVWQRAAVRFRQGTGPQARPRKRPLTGLLICGNCGANMRVSWASIKGEVQNSYYRCCRPGCEVARVRLPDLEAAIRDWLDRWLLTPEALAIAAASLPSPDMAAAQARLTALEESQRRLTTVLLEAPDAGPVQARLVSVQQEIRDCKGMMDCAPAAQSHNIATLREGKTTNLRAIVERITVQNRFPDFVTMYLAPPLQLAVKLWLV